jgi:hypothetical protein
VVITSNLTISETDSSYDGADLVITGPITVAIDGAHSFNSLTLNNGATLTHSACTATKTHKLDLTVANQVTVTTDSKIDVSGKGYLAGRTTGNTTVGATTGMAGGSHGGLGGQVPNQGVPGGAYGKYAEPDDWGSGGGSGNYPDSGLGGGLVWLRAHMLRLDGDLQANGLDNVQRGASAGAGGGILVTVEALAGDGRIEARGGNTWIGQSGYPAAGGGGRAAVYARDYSGFNLVTYLPQGAQGVLRAAWGRCTYGTRTNHRARC